MSEMIGSNRGWTGGVVRGAATLLTRAGRAATAPAGAVDDRWRRNNRALRRARRGPSGTQGRELLNVAATVGLGLGLVVSAAAVSARLAPTVTGRLVVLDEFGTVVDLSGSDEGGPGEEGRGFAAAALAPF